MNFKDNSLSNFIHYDPYSGGLLSSPERISNPMDVILRNDTNPILSKQPRSLPGDTLEDNRHHKITNNSLIERKNIMDVSAKVNNYISKSPGHSDSQKYYKTQDNRIHRKEISQKYDDHYKKIVERYL